MIETTNQKITTQAKISQIKNTQNIQNSNQPLKYRSFDAFYQDYCKKQSYETSQLRNSVSQQPISNTTLKDKKESSKNEESTPQKNKPTVTFTTEDYNIKGRVKRLCAIFQKARKDSNSFANLEKKISKNKITKSSKSPVSSSSSSPGSSCNVVTYLELNTPRPKEGYNNVVKTDLKHKNGVEQILNEEQYVPSNVKDNNNNTDSLSTLSTFNTDNMDINNNITTMDELSDMLATQRISPHNTYCKFDSEIGSVDSSRSDNNALIDDILNRFMNDPEFCDTFFTKLENLNLYSQPGAIQFSKVLDELLYLVENENTPRELSQDHKKDFEWFFNQPKVFNFNVTDQTEQHSTSISHQHEDIDQNHIAKDMEVDSSTSTCEQVVPEDQDLMITGDIDISYPGDNSNNTATLDSNNTHNNNNNEDNELDYSNNTNSTNNNISNTDNINNTDDISNTDLTYEDDLDISSVLQQTNQNLIEYDLYDEITDTSNELGLGNPGDQEDECNIHFDEGLNPEVAKYFEWVKNIND